MSDHDNAEDKSTTAADIEKDIREMEDRMFLSSVNIARTGRLSSFNPGGANPSRPMFELPDREYKMVPGKMRGSIPLERVLLGCDIPVPGGLGDSPEVKKLREDFQKALPNVETYSMGCEVHYPLCSICEAENNECEHLKGEKED